ncbi:hypothetical protein BDV06DRAFT_115171 [Aspergillus oleicola]
MVVCTILLCFFLSPLLVWTGSRGANLKLICMLQWITYVTYTISAMTGIAEQMRILNVPHPANGFPSVLRQLMALFLALPPLFKNIKSKCIFSKIRLEYQYQNATTAKCSIGGDPLESDVAPALQGW